MQRDGVADDAREFAADLRQMRVTPHVAHRNTITAGDP
jgi:hypothetical protein